MIPPTLVYPWFGNNPKPDKIKYCIDSMHKHANGLSVVELNESNTGISELPFVREAYREGKWAYVADFAKLSYLLDWGGISLDADVELLKPLNSFLTHKFFTGQEIDNQKYVTAVMGSRAKHPFLQMMHNYYLLLDEFIPVPNTVFITKLIQTLPLQRRAGNMYTSSQMVIYPQETFCPYDHKKKKILPTINTYTIHHFQGSWKHDICIRNPSTTE